MPSIKIKENETLDELTERIHTVEHLLLPEIINLIINKKVSLEDERVKFNINDRHDKQFIVKNYDYEKSTSSLSINIVFSIMY